MKTQLFFPLITLAAIFSAQAVDIQRWHTPEGTQILLVERHELPMIDYAVIFKGAGSTAEPDGKSDIASPTAKMIMRGTKQLDEESFTSQIKDLGSYVFSNNGLEYSIFGFRSLSESDKLHPTAQLFAQALASPRFEETVFKRLQNQAIVSLKQAESYPAYIASREQAKLNYPAHPYGKSALRTEATIRAVNLADLKTFAQTHYAQNNAIVTIVGDINRADAEQLVKQTIGGLPKRTSAIRPTPPVELTQIGKTQRVPFSGSAQTNISIGLPILKYDDPDYFALLVGNYILGGGGFDSRLMKILRDEKGYTYGVHSSFSAYSEKAPFNISFATEHKNSQAALAATQQVLADFVAQGPSETELQQAKANITGSFPLKFDSNGKLLSNLLDIGLYNRPTDWLDTYNDKVNALTVQDIQRAWQKHIVPTQMNTVVVGE